MKTDLSAYGLTELTHEEAFATSGGMFWGAALGVLGLVALAAAGIAEVVLANTRG
ncbi:hypothetical protein ACVWYH_005200 [Bradyrhizobium sp. GM24.11]